MLIGELPLVNEEGESVRVERVELNLGSTSVAIRIRRNDVIPTEAEMPRGA